MKDVSGDVLFEAEDQYTGIVATLPPRLREKAPDFKKFISPANYSFFMLKGDHEMRGCDTVELSNTGEERLAMINSQHSVTLISAVIAKYYL